MEHVIITKDLAKRLRLIIGYSYAIGSNSVIEELNEAIKTPISGNIAIIDIDSLKIIGGQVTGNGLLMSDKPPKLPPVVKVKFIGVKDSVYKYKDEVNRIYYMGPGSNETVYNIPYFDYADKIPVTFEIVDKF